MLKEDRKKALIVFANSLKLEIENLDLLNIALTHGSYIKGSKDSDNERLEFFGDAVLKLFISEYLMNKYADYSEGQLSKLRAFVVSEKILAKIAFKLNIKKYLMLGKNEKKSLPVSILADSLEALLAVIYYEYGLDKTREFILSYWKEHIEEANKSRDKDNFKASLQEYMQGNKMGLPIYKTLSEVGPDHNKRFEIGIFLDDHKLAVGIGKTKKDAGQNAAKNALILLCKKKGK